MIGGFVLLGLSVAAAVLLVLGGFSRGARLALFVPFCASAVGLLQARDHTCVGLAVRKQCEVGSRLAPVTDSWLAVQLQRQAREVVLESVVAAAFVTGVVLLIPG
jgi:hypothetical protein